MEKIILPHIWVLNTLNERHKSLSTSLFQREGNFPPFLRGGEEGLPKAGQADEDLYQRGERK